MKQAMAGRIIAILFILTIAYSASAQHQDHDHNHVDKPNEVGIAIGAVYAFQEETVATGLHLHYTRMLANKLHWLGFGAGFESVLDLHKHFSANLMITFRPVDLWWISIGPGITYFGEEDEYRYSTHIETGLEFNAGFFHLGPMVEYGSTGDEQHLMFGLHIGIPF